MSFEIEHDTLATADSEPDVEAATRAIRGELARSILIGDTDRATMLRASALPSEMLVQPVQAHEVNPDSLLRTADPPG